MYRRTDEVPYYKGSIFALLQSFVPYSNFLVLIRLLNANHAKITYLCNRFGLFGAVFLWNTAKPLFFLLSFQCLTHTGKALCDFSPVTQARHGAGRVIHT